ncbi:MAG: AAA family ATPase [Planctomycetes bacterium]|nr:AAA family ATPase [Planctomycetota bacterium]
MSYAIAVAGKGGTGKTTFAAIAITLMKNAGKRPILAIDADPNANLGESLGIPYSKTVSDILEQTKGMRDLPAGVNKLQMVEMELHNALVETPGVDLLVMGRPEGPECYCAANNLLRTFTKTLALNYPYIVLDNEAGMEHLSRKTTQNIEVLYLVSDYSIVGIRAVARIRDLVRDLKLAVNKMLVVINKSPSPSLPPQLTAELEKYKLSLAGILPVDEQIINADLNKLPIGSLPQSSPMMIKVREILQI